MGLASEVFHIYDKWKQALKLPRARFIFDNWMLNGWDGLSGPITRFEAILKRKQLRALGVTDLRSIDLNGIWNLVLDQIGVAGSKTRQWKSIREFPARILRSAKFVAPWGSPPGLVVPRTFSLKERAAKAWGSFRHYTTELAAISELSVNSFTEGARRVGLLFAERDPDYDAHFALEVKSRRAQLGLPALEWTQHRGFRARMCSLPAPSFEAYHEALEFHEVA